MIYSMEKVPTTLKAWMEKAIDFHKQKAHIIALKKGQGLLLSSFSSNSCSTKDPDAMDVDIIHLKKLSPADCARCIRQGLCFRCHKKGHVTEFVPLHDIPYIFLSSDRTPYLSIDEFLASPDQHRDLSTFAPDSTFFPFQQ